METLTYSPIIDSITQPDPALMQLSILLKIVSVKTVFNTDCTDYSLSNRIQ